VDIRYIIGIIACFVVALAAVLWLAWHDRRRHRACSCRGVLHDPRPIPPPPPVRPHEMRWEVTYETPRIHRVVGRRDDGTPILEPVYAWRASDLGGGAASESPAAAGAVSLSSDDIAKRPMCHADPAFGKAVSFVAEPNVTYRVATWDDETTETRTEIKS
jgi:hypothetical protein